MNRTIALILIVITLLVGCQIGKEVKPSEMHPNELPDERALQDEFTRNFIQSTEETSPGYYPFLSNTEKYSMDFPADGIVNKEFYGSVRGYESYSVSILSGGYYTLHFDNSRALENSPYFLDAFQGRVGQKVDFEIMEDDNKVIYYTNFHRNDYEYHVAYIHRNKGDGGLEIVYTLDCLEEYECNDPNAEEKANILKWIKSIKFVDEEL